MAVKKSTAGWRDWVPTGIFALFIGALVGYPVVRDKYFPAVPTHTIEYKDKVVEVEKVVEKEVAPTVAINSLQINVEEVIDGSHLKGSVELPLGVTLTDVVVECQGYETFGLTELKGLDAKLELENLIKNSEAVFGMTGVTNRDEDGNVLLTVYVRTKEGVCSVAKWLEDHQFTKTSSVKE